MTKKIVEEFPETEIDPECVVMVKDDAEIAVHPTQVDLWEKQGWKVSE